MTENEGCQTVLLMILRKTLWPSRSKYDSDSCLSATYSEYKEILQ